MTTEFLLACHSHSPSLPEARRKYKDYVKHEYGINIVNEMPKEVRFDVVILAVAHKEFISMDVRSLVKEGGDVKGILPREIVDGRL